jgi:hypothetical protein
LKLTLYRDSKGEESTIGRLCIGEGVSEYLFCYTLEDQSQITKINGETRIPSGTYEIKKRHGSPMANRYDQAHDSIEHNGMLWLQDVPDFKWVYIHIGNTDDDTDGCILVGYHSILNGSMGGGSIAQSRDAYRNLYKEVSYAIDCGEQVFITIKDEGVI